MSAKGAAFYLRHEGVSKSTQKKPNTAAAHFRYITRKSAVIASYNDNFPADWKEGIIFLNRREKTSRANARVCDKVILNLPYSLNDNQRFEAVRDFVRTVGGGRIPVHFSIHGDTNAPHAHVIFVDADIETGRRVFKFTDAGSSYRLRKVWEDTLNRHLSMARTGLQVSRWGREHLERAVANDNIKAQSTTALTPVVPERPQTPLETIPVTVQSPAQEDGMETTLEHVRELLDADREVWALDGHKLNLQNNLSAREEARKDVDRAEVILADYKDTLLKARAAMESAMQDAQPYLKTGGRLAGWQILGWKSRTRKLAEASLTSLRLAETQLTTVQKRVDSTIARIEQDRLRLNRATDKALDISNRFGTEEELKYASKAHQEHVAFCARQLDQKKVDKLLAGGKLTVEDHAKVTRAIREEKEAAERRARHQVKSRSNEDDLGH